MDYRPYFCGICFGFYLALMNKAKLDAGASFLIFNTIGLMVGLALFSQTSIVAIKSANALPIWLVVACACINAVSVIVMFRYLAQTPKEKTGALVSVMIVAQITTAFIATKIFAMKMPTGRELIGLLLATATILCFQE